MFRVKSRVVEKESVLFSELSMPEESVLKAICYFDIFNYPLTADEIRRLSDVSVSENVIRDLVAAQILQQDQGFYYLNTSSIDVEHRQKGNKEAKELIPKAIRQASFIGSFPFVRSVSVSGSMSKGHIDQEGDIDFFIITEPGRLWIARTLLILYKKIFLLNSKKYFCVNYFIDTENLTIEEHNRFTATEVVTLINVYGKKWHQQFLEANRWAQKIYPFYVADSWSAVPRKESVKQSVERFLPKKWAEQLDQYFFRLTLKRWDQRFGTKMAEQDFAVAFKSRRYVSKHHPNHFQKIVLEEWEKRILKIKEKVEKH